MNIQHNMKEKIYNYIDGKKKQKRKHQRKYQEEK
jgi:hypothetical protein